jgi:hypothetical protein
VSVGDVRNAANPYIFENDNCSLDRCRRDAGEHVRARRDESRNCEHTLVVVIDQTRTMSGKPWSDVSGMAREMRMHLTRVVVIGVVVVQVHVHHRRGDRACLNGDD